LAPSPATGVIALAAEAPSSGAAQIDEGQVGPRDQSGDEGEVGSQGQTGDQGQSGPQD